MRSLIAGIIMGAGLTVSLIALNGGYLPGTMPSWVRSESAWGEIIATYSKSGPCLTIPGEKGKNGAGNGGDGLICGTGFVIGAGGAAR